MDPKQQEIARLLREGLDHYGEGDADAAVHAWNAVLALDPDNADARDYIDSVDAGADEEPSEDIVLLDAELTLLEAAVGLLADAREVDALAVLGSAMESAEGELDLETLAVYELVRARLLPIYRAGFRADVTPRATGGAVQLEALGLPPAALALHAACDGKTAIEGLSAATGLDCFETFHQLSVLVDTGLVSLYA